MRLKAASILLPFVSAITLSEQTPITFQYYYGDLNQLAKVVDSNAVAIEYDSVGNILEYNPNRSERKR